ncbi:hypothetical protein PAXRUDRAFT_291414 [Paxillus rubicundulus Ve08.2h10]|uniref:Uncharacterized protein n=1 Tax=Paxillus rubicundulus Ve08.2h10 TaxID=930991 RepID=A0A0D0CUM0_9AGAM|nr:hypothetical protein PAXRUDRAFT_291414 [Paxillus rubicundulus Ve08.2h10]
MGSHFVLLIQQRLPCVISFLYPMEGTLSPWFLYSAFIESICPPTVTFDHGVLGIVETERPKSYYLLELSFAKKLKCTLPLMSAGLHLVDACAVSKAHENWTVRLNRPCFRGSCACQPD